jgi:hypothetical protein
MFGSAIGVFEPMREAWPASRMNHSTDRFGNSLDTTKFSTHAERDGFTKKVKIIKAKVENAAIGGCVLAIGALLLAVTLQAEPAKKVESRKEKVEDAKADAAAALKPPVAPVIIVAFKAGGNGKVRLGEGAETDTRGACAPQRNAKVRLSGTRKPTRETRALPGGRCIFRIDRGRFHPS